MTSDLCCNNCKENSIYTVTYKHTTENHQDNGYLLIKGQAPEDIAQKHEPQDNRSPSHCPQGEKSKKAPRVAAKDDEKSG